jgi:glycosyltransferase involved in cell wall biosynthesis
VRVLLVSANYLPHVGGIERFTQVLARGLARRAHEVTVLCCRYGGAPLREEGEFTVERVPASFALERRAGVPYPLPVPLALHRALRRALDRADVVHVQDALYATSVLALALSRRRRLPSVLTQHVAFVPQSNRVLNAVEHAAIATLGRSARLATAVATLTPSVAEWVAEHWSPRDVRVLPVGIAPPDAPTTGPVELRRSFGLPEGRFLALFVGRDVPKKGLDVFLAAGGLEYDLVAVTDRTPVEGAIGMPFMEHDRLQELLSCADAFVLPSEGEGFPVVLQEAFAAGLPVITTPHPGYDHYIRSDDVLLVERKADSVRAALLRLAGDPALQERLAERSRAVAERHFGEAEFVTAYEELYEDVMSR